MAGNRKKFEVEGREETGVRINKYLSDAGICSRREADVIIAAGKVTIDGKVAETGSRVFEGQQVCYNGKPLKKQNKQVLIAFYKPVGIVCTTDTKREKDNVIDYIKYPERIYPIGRLDKDSEGLLLLTNDGDIVNKILRAGNQHEKEYLVTVNKPIDAAFLKGMAGGVPILDTITKPCRIEPTGKCSFRIILTQGLNRQIRRMCEYFGYRVMSLKRVRIMHIQLGHLLPGTYRNLTDAELSRLERVLKTSSGLPVAEQKKLQKEALEKENGQDQKKPENISRRQTGQGRRRNGEQNGTADRKESKNRRTGRPVK